MKYSRGGSSPRRNWRPSRRSAGGEKEAHGEFESECPGSCGAQDTFDVGTLKGVGRIYEQTFVDTYTNVAFAKLYTEKTPIAAADLLNDRVLPFFEAHGIPLRRILTDRGRNTAGHAGEDEEPAGQRDLRARAQDAAQ